MLFQVFKGKDVHSIELQVNKFIDDHRFFYTVVSIATGFIDNEMVVAVTLKKEL